MKCNPNDALNTQGSLLYLNVDRRSNVCRMKLAGLRRFAHLRGWVVTPVFEDECGDIQSLLTKFRPAGCVVECGWGDGAKHFPINLFGRTPVVYLDCEPGRFGNRACRVIHDNSATIVAASRELLRLRLPHFAFVGWPVQVFWSVLRADLFTEEMAKRGQSCKQFQHMVRRGQEHIWRLRLHEWVAALPIPCGVLAANDKVAVEVVKACKANGLRVPEDVAVLGIDNDGDMCYSVGPPISSIQIDFENAGYRAAEQIAAGAPAGDVTFGCMAVISRQSTQHFSSMRLRIVTAMEHIRRKACDGLTAASVLAIIGGSRRAAEMHFRQSVGRSILEEIQSVRIERVLYYLECTSLPIEALAALCGYPTSWALRKAFRKATGMSMRAWRLRSRRMRDEASTRSLRKSQSR
jgi:LacI family transcriptional regulator